MSLVFKPGDRILMIGDSITAAGRDLDNPLDLGSGYVAVVAGILQNAHPEMALRFTNRGINGNTVMDLKGRWGRDVVAESPDWLSVSVGINDVWRLYSEDPYIRATAVPVGQYRETYRGLIERAQEATNARLILMEPGIIGQDLAAEANRQLEPYVEAVQEFARKFEAILAPVREAFRRVLQADPDYPWTGDGVHPTMAGHVTIAAAWLKAAGMPIFGRTGNS